MTLARRSLQSGEALYYAQDTQPNIYIVCTGSLKSVIDSAEGDEQITGFYFPGDIIGTDGLGGTAHLSTALAIEPTTVCEIPEQSFSSVCVRNNALNHKFMVKLRNEIVLEQRHLLILGQLHVDARIACFFIFLSKRFEEMGYSALEFHLKVPRHDIANYLGIAPETLSRVLHGFQENGYLRINRRNIVIADMEALYGLAGMNPCS
jgi:CRP/FNR family transcriptional regulator